jgi:pyrroline-5-carboxylate reductase
LSGRCPSLSGAFHDIPATHPSSIAFIGGGNMASAIIGGLLAQGLPAASITVVEPFEAARDALKAKFGIDALPAATAALQAPNWWSGPSSPRPSRTRPLRQPHTATPCT